MVNLAQENLDAAIRNHVFAVLDNTAIECDGDCRLTLQEYIEKLRAYNFSGHPPADSIDMTSLTLDDILYACHLASKTPTQRGVYIGPASINIRRLDYLEPLARICGDYLGHYIKQRLNDVADGLTQWHENQNFPDGENVIVLPTNVYDHLVDRVATPLETTDYAHAPMAGILGDARGTVKRYHLRQDPITFDVIQFSGMPFLVQVAARA